RDPTEIACVPFTELLASAGWAKARSAVPTRAFMSLVSLDYVKARWAYSELLSDSFGHLYGGAERLKEKAARNLPFERLTPEDIALLVFMFNTVRGAYFNPYFTGANKFSLSHWTKEELGAICVIPFFSDEFGLERMTFRDWVETPPAQELSKNDPRQE